MKFTLNKNLFHVKDKGYVLTNDNDICLGDHCINTATNVIYTAGTIEMVSIEQFAHRKHTNKKIIATDSSLKLESIPQFQILTSDDVIRFKADKIVEDALKIANGLHSKDSFTEQEQIIMLASWYDGYKAAADDSPFSLSDLKLLAKEIESGRKDAWCKKNTEIYGTYTDAEIKWWENFICAGNNKQLVSLELETEDNQCDGCKANLPLDGNIHKDNQSLGIMCSKDRYDKPKIYYTEPDCLEGLYNVTNCVYERIM